MLSTIRSSFVSVHGGKSGATIGEYLGILGYIPTLEQFDQRLLESEGGNTKAKMSPNSLTTAIDGGADCT